MEDRSQKSFKLNFNHQLYDYWKNTGSRLFKLTKIDCRGLERIAQNEPAVLTPNHLNWKDILLTASMFRRPINFVASFTLFDKHACYKLLEQHFKKYAKYPALKIALDRFNNYLANFLTDRVKHLGTIPAKLPLIAFMTLATGLISTTISPNSSTVSNLRATCSIANWLRSIIWLIFLISAHSFA